MVHGFTSNDADFSSRRKGLVPGDESRNVPKRPVTSRENRDGLGYIGDPVRFARGWCGTGELGRTYLSDERASYTTPHS